MKRAKRIRITVISVKEYIGAVDLEQVKDDKNFSCISDVESRR